MDGVPRILDGSLDRNPMPDMGAYEFSHAEVHFGGNLRPGGQLTIDINGPEWLHGLLYMGLDSNVIQLGAWGTLFLTPFDITRPHHLGPLPRLLFVDIPNNPELIGTTFYGQAVAYQPNLKGGTLSNRASATIVR